MDADIGVIGLAVMGQNLILNMADRGFTVAAFNRSLDKVDLFAKGPAKGKSILCTRSIEEFVGKLKSPKKIMLMVKAGEPVDAFLEKLVPHLAKNAIIIDGGNSHYTDTQRRYASLKKQGILFLGVGISGGEEGARHGPSIMPGGNKQAWPHVQPIFQAIAAKSADNEPCCDWVGEAGAGHYVKMVHNGIEYGDMQLIAEVYDLLRNCCKKNPEELHQIFREWNRGALNSYLIEITAHIFTTKDSNNQLILDQILDVAGQKGTGKWTGISALEEGMPVSLIVEAVFARCLSSLYEERKKASSIYPVSLPKEQIDTTKLAHALYAAKIISYAQGFMLMRAASDKYAWHLDYGAIALMWRGGCIIRSKFLGEIRDAYKKNPELHNLLLDAFFAKEMKKMQEDLREVVAKAVLAGVAVPALSAALSFFDAYRRNDSAVNLIQAQRDFFGAHTYERKDQERGKYFHTNWTKDSGNISSSSYDA